MSNSVMTPTPRRWKAVVLLVLTFAAGAVFGIAADHLYLLRSRQMYPRAGVEHISKRVVERLDRTLDLTTGQRQQVERIVRERTTRVDAVWKSVEPRVREEIRRADREIEALLNAEQKRKFAELRAKWQQRARRFGGEHRRH